MADSRDYITKFGKILNYMTISIVCSILGILISMAGLILVKDSAFLFTICFILCSLSLIFNYFRYSSFKLFRLVCSPKNMKKKGYMIFSVKFFDTEKNSLFTVTEYGKSEQELRTFWTDYFNKQGDGKYKLVDVTYNCEIGEPVKRDEEHNSENG